MNVYVYPSSTKSRAGFRNPYLGNFMASLAPHCNVVNKDRPTSYGLFGVLPWLRGIDVLVLHWAENIADKRGAVAQIALLRALLLAKRVAGFRLVYVLHNKVSHETSRFRWKERILRMVLRHADVVITHAQEGMDFAAATWPPTRDKIHYLPHPFDSSKTFVHGVDPFEQRPYDVLVWGRMAPYKGLADLVRFLNAKGLQQRYRILVAGQFADAAAFASLSKDAPFMTFDNRFIPDDELRRLMGATKVILFPYRRDSVLGSTALMDALLSDAVIVGPNTGAFRDCAELGLISAFDDLSDLTGVIDHAVASDRVAIVARRKAFAAQHTWEAFGRAVVSLIGG